MKKLVYLMFSLAALFLLSASSSQKEEKHVVFIGLDGWSAYCMDKADMPNTKKLMKEGAYTLKKRSVLPSSSAVNWATMFMGACPELHGYTLWNSRTPEIPSRVVLKNGIFPTVFQLLRDQHPTAEIGCIYEWSGIRYVVDTLSLSYCEKAPESDHVNETTCRLAEEYIKGKRPDLLAVIFDEPDHTGHKAGHDTEEYYARVKELDGYIGKIIQATKDAGIYEKTVFILTGDHGGINKGHGGKSLQELECPFIISGAGIKKRGEYQGSMMQFDVTSMIAGVFKLEQPQVWIGRPVKGIFKQ